MKNINHLKENLKGELPVIHLWYQYLVVSYNILDGVPKKLKFSVVDNIIKSNFKILNLLIRAKFSTNSFKRESIEIAIIEIETIRFMYRFLFESKNISFKQYNLLIEHLISCGKMCNGWSKHVSSK